MEKKNCKNCYWPRTIENYEEIIEDLRGLYDEEEDGPANQYFPSKANINRKLKLRKTSLKICEKARAFSWRYKECDNDMFDCPGWERVSWYESNETKYLFRRLDSEIARRNVITGQSGLDY